jgi:preprotein translocase subunit SecD
VETGYWVRLGAIAAMTVASIYILLPTVVRVIDGPEAELVTKAGKADKPKKLPPDLKIEFEALDVDAAKAAVSSVERRLRVAGVPVENVFANQRDLVVKLAPGGTRDATQAAVDPMGAVALYALTDLGIAVDADVATSPETRAVWTAVVPLGGTGVPEGKSSLTAEGVAFDAPPSGDVTLTAGGLSQSELLVAVDGKLAAMAWRGAGATSYTVLPLVDAGRAHDRAAWPAGSPSTLAGGPLPSALRMKPQAGAVAASDDAPKAAVASNFPEWFRKVLPANLLGHDTALALGLDLQGGIELTLQVELEEAVASQVGRDAQFVKDMAPKDNISVDAARRDPGRPVIRVQTPVPLADLQAWMVKKLGQNYSYEATELTDGKAEHLFVMTDTAQQRVSNDATEQVLETLRKRIDATGVKEPSIVKKGGGRVGVQLPGESDLQGAIDAIGTTAVLEFRLVDEEFPRSEIERLVSAARAALPKDQFEDDLTVDAWLHQQKLLADDRVMLFDYDDSSSETHTRASPVVLKAEVLITGNDIAGAQVSYDGQTNEPFVSMDFKSRGSQVFCKTTGDNIGKRFAIILDDEIRSTPTIQAKICGGSSRITMGDDSNATQAANTLAVVLRTGSLNAPVSIGEVRTVGATLGRDAIVDGLLGTVLGSMLVFLYMTVWYRWSGVIANATLVLNILLVMASLGMLGATLTLPGICGLALTTGMAVDANIIIYERIREELRHGMNVRKAVDAGFDKAFIAIMDGHVTTGIAGIVLYSYGTGPIKGFAVALIIGIVTTLITALWVSRTLMELLTRNSNARLSI